MHRNQQSEQTTNHSMGRGSWSRGARLVLIIAAGLLLGLARFAQSARDEVELEALTGEVTRVVHETLQPEQVSLWLRKTA